jgi:hypothetical protein
MRLAARLLWILVTIGCNEVEAPATAPVDFMVQEYPVPGEDPAPLEGVQICETNATNCTVTDADGTAKLELPVGGTEFSYTVEADGYATYLVGDINPRGFKQTIVMVTNQEMAEQHARVGSDYPMRGTGTVLLQILPALPGATFDLRDATGMPFYLDEAGDWSRDLKATTNFGWGGFTDVSPGEFQINVGGIAGCVLPTGIGWLGDVQNSVRLPVQEGYTTLAAMRCPPLPR